MSAESAHFDRIGEILDDKLGPLADRTQGLAKHLSESLNQSDEFLFHLAGQISENLVRLERLADEALLEWRMHLDTFNSIP